VTDNTGNSVPRIAITAGEPAGIAPDITLALARRDWDAELVVLSDNELLQQRADALGFQVALQSYDPNQAPAPSRGGALTIAPIHFQHPVRTGKPDADNAGSVLESLNRACDGCMQKEFDAMVTPPIQKSTISDSGTPFSGHTEYLAERSGAALPVMMLATATGNKPLRVALVTTHLPLRAVADAITRERVIDTIRIVNHDLQKHFGIGNPSIAVLGLNPHAGEDGHLGTEEQQIIQPAIEELRADGLNLSDALPADTAFTQRALGNYDAVVAMYHDQGLPVIKHAGFGDVVNVTLGLPIIRTSVDHGTALDLAGSGDADPESLYQAVDLAITMAKGRRN